MTATDELRRMLDERGVEHVDAEDGHTQHTWWSDGDHEIAACNSGKRLAVYNLTPEQAIEATIGRTTTRHGKHKTRWGREVPLCERCGYAIGDSRYHYCPSCGAKVVEE